MKKYLAPAAIGALMAILAFDCAYNSIGTFQISGLHIQQSEHRMIPERAF
jgi:hypothetical protein